MKRIFEANIFGEGFRNSNADDTDEADFRGFLVIWF
jgi:hypothetical protein